MINTLQIVPKLDVGGIESALYNYYLHMDRERIQFHFVVYGSDVGYLEEKMIQMGAVVFHVTPKKENFIKFIRELVSIYHKNKYDIVHAHQSEKAYIPLAIAKICHVKIRIAHSHTCMSQDSHRSIKRKLLFFLNKYFATDIAYCGISAGEWAYGDAKEGKWIANGVDVDKFKFNLEKRNSLRKQYNVCDSDIVLGMMCRLSVEKNIEFAIEIMDRLVNDQCKNNYKLFIVGDGNEKEHLDEGIRKKKLERNVFLTGQVDDAYNYYSFFDLFLLPSFYEGFPVSLVEAQCAGLCSIISDRISREAAISDFVYSRGIDKKDLNSWIELIENFENHGRYFNEKLKNFDSKHLAEELTRYYENLVAKNA